MKPERISRGRILSGKESGSRVGSVEIWLRLAAGAMWGACMIIMNVFLGAAGHGVFTPLWLSAAPASLLGTSPSWLLSIPICIVLAGMSHSRVFPWLVCFHYVTGLVVVAMEPADLEALGKLPSSFSILFVCNMLLYLGGHVCLWRSWLSSKRAMKTSTMMQPS